MVMVVMTAACGVGPTEPGSEPGSAPEETPRPTTPEGPPPLPNPFGSIQLWSHPNALIPHVQQYPDSWGPVADVVEVFGLFVGAVNNSQVGIGYYDEALAPLASTGRAVALEVGGLRPFACTGVKSANGDEKAIQQLASAGFSEIYLRMDNPMTFVLAGAFHENPCQHSVQSAVTELIVYQQTVAQRHPELTFHFGWDEAFYLHQWPGFPRNNQGFDGGDLKEMMTTWFTAAAAAGVPLEFFHVDASLNTHLAYDLNTEGDPWARLNAAADHVRSLGARFGILLNFSQPCPGGCSTHSTPTTGAEFVKRTLTYYDCVIQNGGTLDDVVPESWWSVPGEYFPTQAPDTFGFLTMALAERIAVPSAIEPCPTATFNGKWVFTDD